MQKKTEELETPKDVLYLKYRPTKFNEVVGQETAIGAIKAMRGNVPRAVLFTGPSGTGKTTLARILRMKLGCGDMDFQEINTSNFRGIDDIRGLTAEVSMSPISGACRVWLIDECHGMTKDAQNCFLKLLEDTPKHCYFFLATTDPEKLVRTIKTRCTVIRCQEVPEKALFDLVVTTAAKEGKKISDEVAKRISECSLGSARQALVHLNTVLNMTDEKVQIDLIEADSGAEDSIKICRLLFNNRATWKEMAEVLTNVKGEPESLRRLVLGYARSVLLKSGSKRAIEIIDEFQYNLFDTGAAGLAAACYRALN